MCGICGAVFNDRSRTLDASVLMAMRDAIAHRGPDDAGIMTAPGVALGSRRLSIIDLSERGHMPMQSADGRYTIVYNGEVYNFAELRSTLRTRDYPFRSHTDTEVLLALYADFGTGMLDRLNGMFAFAIWDAVERVLFIARDRLGIKPLYYAEHSGGLWFASEEKALFAAGLKPAFDETCWEELLCFRYVAGASTPYKGVSRLLPGHYLLWKDGMVDTHRWWNLGERARALRETLPADPVAWFGETFDSAVKLRRISDVPIGVLLSGGLDSSTVAASLASQGGKGTASFTVRFDEEGYDEGPYARLVAEHCKLAYHELKVPPANLMTSLRQASWLNDEPLVHGNDLHLWAISVYAKPLVTVLLSGEGADELLGGYVRYRPLRYPALLRTAGPAMSLADRALKFDGRLRKLTRFLAMRSMEQFVLFNACDVLPGDLAGVGLDAGARFPYREAILREAQGLYPYDLMRQAMYSDLHTFLCSILDRNDRMTMGASIECRVPFLDYRLVEGVAALPSRLFKAGGQSKYLMRKSLSERLPEAIRKHRKWGFGVPWTAYFRRTPELRAFVAGLPGYAPVNRGPFNASKVRAVIEEFLKGEGNHDALVRQLVMVAVWHQACVEKSGTD
jgi:asparagine synthase (glutamine-hydrolysing)